MENITTIKLKIEDIQALFEGKRLEYHQIVDGEKKTIVIISDRYGVFMTHEKANDLRWKVQREVYDKILELFEGNKKDI